MPSLWPSYCSYCCCCCRYLYQNTQPGVQDYLCNKLYELPEDSIEKYLLQFVYLAVSKQGSALERTLVSLCTKSFRSAVKVRCCVYGGRCTTLCDVSHALMT